MVWTCIIQLSLTWGDFIRKPKSWRGSMYNKVKMVISLKQGQSRVGRRSMDVTDGVTRIVFSGKWLIKSYFHTPWCFWDNFLNVWNFTRVYGIVYSGKVGRCSSEMVVEKPASWPSNGLWKTPSLWANRGYGAPVGVYLPSWRNCIQSYGWSPLSSGRTDYMG